MKKIFLVSMFIVAFAVLTSNVSASAQISPDGVWSAEMINPATTCSRPVSELPAGHGPWRTVCFKEKISALTGPVELAYLLGIQAQLRLKITCPYGPRNMYLGSANENFTEKTTFAPVATLIPTLSLGGQYDNYHIPQGGSKIFDVKYSFSTAGLPTGDYIVDHIFIAANPSFNGRSWIGVETNAYTPANIIHLTGKGPLSSRKLDEYCRGNNPTWYSQLRNTGATTTISTGTTPSTNNTGSGSTAGTGAGQSATANNGASTGSNSQDSNPPVMSTDSSDNTPSSGNSNSNSSAGSNSSSGAGNSSGTSGSGNSNSNSGAGGANSAGGGQQTSQTANQPVAFTSPVAGASLVSGQTQSISWTTRGYDVGSRGTMFLQTENNQNPLEEYVIGVDMRGGTQRLAISASAGRYKWVMCDTQDGMDTRNGPYCPVESAHRFESGVFTITMANAPVTQSVRSGLSSSFQAPMISNIRETSWVSIDREKKTPAGKDTYRFIGSISFIASANGGTILPVTSRDFVIKLINENGSENITVPSANIKVAVAPTGQIAQGGSSKISLEMISNLYGLSIGRYKYVVKQITWHGANGTSVVQTSGLEGLQNESHPVRTERVSFLNSSLTASLSVLGQIWNLFKI